MLRTMACSAKNDPRCSAPSGSSRLGRAVLTAASRFPARGSRRHHRPGPAAPPEVHSANGLAQEPKERTSMATRRESAGPAVTPARDRFRIAWSDQLVRLLVLALAVLLVLWLARGLIRPLLVGWKRNTPD